MAGKVPGPGDKSEDLPFFPCFALAPRIGRVRRMSETIEDCNEMSGAFLRESVCGVMCSGKESYPVFYSQLIEKNELLFDNNTCLMSARFWAVAQRIRVMAYPQMEWGGREVSPSCRKFYKN